MTGGPGFIGQALIRDLVTRGHVVSTLSRSDAGNRLLADLGAKVINGSLADVDALSARFRRPAPALQD